jgi:hypothetical protein
MGLLFPKAKLRVSQQIRPKILLCISFAMLHSPPILPLETPESELLMALLSKLQKLNFSDNLRIMQYVCCPTFGRSLAQASV